MINISYRYKTKFEMYNRELKTVLYVCELFKIKSHFLSINWGSHLLPYCHYTWVPCTHPNILDRFHRWRHSGAPDSSEDTVWNSSLCSNLVWGNLLIINNHMVMNLLIKIRNIRVNLIAYCKLVNNYLMINGRLDTIHFLKEKKGGKL